MRYQPVDTKVQFPALEERILAWWREARIFERTLEARADAPTWLFYEGPPTANGKPGIHHVEPRTFKDVYPRYKTMTGHLVPRKGGWDCHGLPVEIEVEKEIGTTGKRDIEAYGVAEFNERCRASVQRYVGEFERLTERIGFWIDMSEAYWTMATPYIESVWWSLKRLHERGLLVQDHKVTAYCPRCGTALSDAEVAQGYAHVADPSVYLRFPIVDSSRPDLVGASLLVWTTTPWTLPSNEGAAVLPNGPYAVFERAGERLIVAKPLAGSVLGDDWVEGDAFTGGSPGRRAIRAALPERGGRAHRRRGGVRLDGGRHRHRAPRAGVRSGRPRRRTRAGLAGLATGRRRRHLHRRRPVLRARPLRQGRRPADHRGSARAGRPVRCGHLRARLPVLLAMRYSPPVPRAHVLVRAYDRGEGTAARGERRGHLDPRAHQAGAVRQLAREQRRLGALAGALLGHAAADLAVHEHARHRGRLADGALVAGRARRHRRRPASPVHRRDHLRLPDMRCDRDAACPR